MIKGFLFDLDGVFYIDNSLIKGANDVINWFRDKKIIFRFLTNNTTLSRKDLVIKLNLIGLKINEDEIISANYAGVLLLKKLNIKSCRLVLSEKAKEDYKIFKIEKDKPEAIIVGDIGDLWNYNLMNELMNQILNGSKLIALHKGRYFQKGLGLTIDSGPFVSGLEYATQTNAIVVGKPEATFFKLASEKFNLKSNEIGMVGDDLNNDILGGLKMGYKTFLVRTGKFRKNIFEKSNINPDYCINSISDLPRMLELKKLI